MAKSALETRTFPSLSRVELRSMKARCEKEGLFKSSDFSHEKVPDPAGWRGCALGPWSARAARGEEAKASRGILAGLENTVRENYICSVRRKSWQGTFPLSSHLSSAEQTSTNLPDTSIRQGNITVP